MEVSSFISQTYKTKIHLRSELRKISAMKYCFLTQYSLPKCNRNLDFLEMLHEFIKLINRLEKFISPKANGLKGALFMNGDQVSSGSDMVLNVSKFSKWKNPSLGAFDDHERLIVDRPLRGILTKFNAEEK